MKENEYDNPAFFEAYRHMERSIKGLQGAGEWHELQQLLPDLKGKTMLDLGCGFGWHCDYAIKQGATSVIGIDLSEKMLEQANRMNSNDHITYLQCAMEDYSYPENAFDVVLSSLALHYIESFEYICKKVYRTLTAHGKFIFSVEHPIFTANGTEEWNYTKDGTIQDWPVDRYFEERLIHSYFLGQDVVKYHKTLATFINTLLETGFVIRKVVEPMPTDDMLQTIPEMKEELRRPMMLLLSAEKLYTM